MSTKLARKHANRRHHRVRISKYAQGRICAVTGKRQFETPELAEQEIAQLQKRRAAERNPHVENRHYLCPTCFKFHLTSEKG